MSDPKTDAAYQAAIKEWEDRGYKVLPKLAPPDLSWVQDWANWNKAVLDAVKLIFGDRDGWSYFGNLFLYSLGEGQLTGDQKLDVDAIRVILAKTEMSYADLGELHGRILHLLSPQLRTILSDRAPGVLAVLDVIGRIGGVA